MALNLVLLLNSNRQTGLIHGIAEFYQQLLDAERGVEIGTLITAVPLGDKQMSKAEDTLEAIVGKKIRLSTKIQPNVVGGIIAKIGDRVIDGSFEN